MKVASKVLYIVGLVMNILQIMACIFYCCFAHVYAQRVIAYLNEAGVNPSQYGLTVELVMAALLSGLITFIVLNVVAVVFGSIAVYRASKNDPNKTHHILAIVAGGLSDSAFYIVGGILGLVASKNDAKQVEIVE